MLLLSKRYSKKYRNNKRAFINLIKINAKQFDKLEFGVELYMDLKARAKKLKTDIPALFLAIKDNDTPILAKVFAGITVAYALSPVDLVPDFIPVLGYLDDIILLPMLVAITIKFIPQNVLERNRKEAEGMWQDGKPKKWYYAIPIIVIWIIIIGLILKAVLGGMG